MLSNQGEHDSRSRLSEAGYAGTGLVLSQAAAVPARSTPSGLCACRCPAGCCRGPPLAEWYLLL